MKNQKGFTTPLLILLVLALVVAAGYMVTQRGDSNDDDTNTVTQTNVEEQVSIVQTTDSTGSLNYSYPSNWSIVEYEWDPCCSGPPKTEPDWTQISQPIELKPESAHEDVKIRFSFDPTGTEEVDYESKTIEEMWDERTIDQFNEHERISINGADVLHTVTDFVGPAEVEAYKDHYYTFFKSDIVATIRFREHYRHNWNDEETNGQTNYNATEYLDDFEAIVRSIEIK